jgi:hypothetical protein
VKSAAWSIAHARGPRAGVVAICSLGGCVLVIGALWEIDSVDETV